MSSGSRDRNDPLFSRVECARDRDVPWDGARANRVFGRAVERRAASRARHAMVRRGVAVAAGAMMIAFGFRAVAFAPHAQSAEAATSTAQEVAPQPIVTEVASRGSDPNELASRPPGDAGYTRD